jgi:hypothetical protein
MRIQITDEWRDKSINQELEENEKLERILVEERDKAQYMAYQIYQKQLLTEQKRV